MAEPHAPDARPEWPLLPDGVRPEDFVEVETGRRSLVWVPERGALAELLEQPGTMLEPGFTPDGSVSEISIIGVRHGGCGRER